MSAARKKPGSTLRKWGIAYVIRGSRLGAAILRRRVPPAFPTSFLDFAPMLAWPEFLKELDRENGLLVARAHAPIILGAEQAFKAFSTAAAGLGLCSE